MAVSQETPEWECVLEARANVGECPIWSAEQRVLFWIDVYKPALYRTEPESGTTDSWLLPATVGSYALQAEGRAIVALSTGIYDLDLRSKHLTLLGEAPYDTRQYRFNDGRCDRQGRFWVGTTRLPTSSRPNGSSAFWRFDQRGLSLEVQGTTTANGIAFSPDGRTLYLADEPNGQILALTYDPETGTASDLRTFACVPEGTVPDGAAVDSDGGYWIALIRAGRILRFGPDGTLDRELKAPCSTPTMVCFGGPGLGTLYVTTARRPLDEEGLGREPLAGAIFRSDVGARGVSEPFFVASPFRVK